MPCHVRSRERRENVSFWRRRFCFLKKKKSPRFFLPYIPALLATKRPRDQKSSTRSPPYSSYHTPSLLSADRGEACAVVASSSRSQDLREMEEMFLEEWTAEQLLCFALV